MTRPYSEDLRERAVARYEAGETTRSIAAALRISPSCVSKWMKLKRETGSLAPGQVGGHKKPRLSGAPAAWLRDRKSTRLNSSHTVISYAVFCLKKKKKP